MQNNLALKQEIKIAIMELEQMIKNNSKDRVIKEKKRELDEKLKKYLKNL